MRRANAEQEGREDGRSARRDAIAPSPPVRPPHGASQADGGVLTAAPDVPVPDPEQDEACPLLLGRAVLVVDTYGAYLGKRSERLQVRCRTEVVREAPLMDLEQVLVTSSGVSVSSDALRSCAERGIPVSFLTRRGDYYGTLYPPQLNGTVATRRAQLLAALDGRGIELARAIVVAKLTNQAALLKYMAKYRKTVEEATYERVREAAYQIEHLATRVPLVGVGRMPLTPDPSPSRGEGSRPLTAAVEAVRALLMNLEAQAGRWYWQAVASLLRAHAPDWPGREHRGTNDPVNAALNYGYAVLQTQVQRAILVAGLDPYGGYLHVDRPGRESLTLDLMEEFRQPVVDRVVFALVNRGTALEMEPVQGPGQRGTRGHEHAGTRGHGDAETQACGDAGTQSDAGEAGAGAAASSAASNDHGNGGNGDGGGYVAMPQLLLTQRSRTAVLAKVLERLEGVEPYEQRRRRLRHVIQLQARHVATFLRGERREYRGFVARW